MLKTRIHALRDEGLHPFQIAERLGASIDYVRYVSNIYAGGLGSGDIPLHADHLKHLRKIAAASDGKGFPYCVAASSTAPAQIGGQKLTRPVRLSATPPKAADH
jgi:hypothetical protein